MPVGARYNKYHDIKEEDIEKYFVDKVEASGGRAMRFDPRNNRGWPDYVLLYPGGYIFFVELKRPGQVPRRNQAAFLQALRNLGFQATYISTYDQVNKFVEYVRSYRTTMKFRPVDQLCIRRDCILRLIQEGVTQVTGGKV